MARETRQGRTVLMVIGLCLAFAGGLWLPQHLRASRLKDQIAQARTQIQEDQDDAAQLTQRCASVARLQQVLEHSDKVVPVEDPQADLLRQLTKQVRGNGLEQAELVTHTIAIGADYRMIPLTLRVTGPFPGVFGLVRDIEADARVVRISRLEIGRTGDKPGQVEATLELATFFAPQEEQP